MDIIVVIGLCLIIASMLKGYYDKSSENRIKNPWFFDVGYWNKSAGYKYKWKLDEDGNIVKDKNGARVERFWGSSRWFVFLTDGWHLIQFIMYRFLDYPMLHIIHNRYGNPWITVVSVFIIVLLRGAFFELIHRKEEDRDRYTLFNLCTRKSTKK